METSENLPYNPKDKKSIEKYAKNLLNKSLRDILGDVAVQNFSGKGKLGQSLEKLYFQYEPNSISQPDFPDAGVELKTTPLKIIKKGIVSKERLVFNIINFNEEHKKTFEESDFWKKNKLLLLMMYLYEKDKIDLDYIFKIIELWEFPKGDLKIIQDDWEKIISKIKQGKAHEISEGDTIYLSACTKGANKKSLRQQPFSKTLAKQRAYSLKQKYLNYIIMDYLNNENPKYKSKLKDTESIIKDIDSYRNGQTFEDLIHEKFSKYVGKSESELMRLFSINTSSKSRFFMIAKSILGIKKTKIEEFEKGDIEMKTIRLEESGNLKESMSFAQIKYKEIVSETWEDSYLYKTLTKRFLFVIFKKDKNKKLRFERILFWTMPQKDLELAKDFWLETKNKIDKGDFESFRKASEDKIFHVRPKAKNSLDLMETKQGKMEKRKAYWLNSSYIKEVLERS